MSNDEDLVDLVLYCADICIKLKRAAFGKQEAEISKTTTTAISELERYALRQLPSMILLTLELIGRSRGFVPRSPRQRRNYFW
jgi:hypothetical protein